MLYSAYRVTQQLAYCVNLSQSSIHMSLNYKSRFRQKLVQRKRCQTFSESLAKLVYRQLIAYNSIHLQRYDGAYTLAVPLLNSEKRVFSLLPENSVKDLIERIASEDPSIETVQLRKCNGSTVKEDELLEQLVLNDFQLVLNENVHFVHASKAFAYDSASRETDISAQTFDNKVAVIALRDALENEPRWKITLDEYRHLCEAFGISETQGTALLTKFHESGVVLHFGKPYSENAMGNQIFLQPRIVLDAYFESLGLPSISRQKFLRKKRALKEEIAVLEPQFSATNKLYRQLQKNASRYSNMFSYALTGSLVSGFGLYFWLSFFHYSWDIMEPVTYFTGFGVSIIGYTWWSLTNQEYEYQNIYDYIYQKRLQTLVAQEAFNRPLYRDLAAKIRFLKDRVDEIDAVLSKPVQLHAKYLHLLRDEVQYTKVLGDPHYVSLILKGMNRNATQSANQKLSLKL